MAVSTRVEFELACDEWSHFMLDFHVVFVANQNRWNVQSLRIANFKTSITKSIDTFAFHHSQIVVDVIEMC